MKGFLIKYVSQIVFQIVPKMAKVEETRVRKLP